MSQEESFNLARYDAMPYNRCGKSGLKLPALSLGGWHNFSDRELAGRLMRHAFDRGVTHFDLANNYGIPPGSAEESVGEVLQSDFAAHRGELIVSSKAGYDMWPGPYGDGGSRKYLLSSLDASLQRLKLDYVDIFYSHRFDPETPLEETMSALDQAVRSGKALYAGISNYNEAQLVEASGIMDELGTPLLIHQFKYSLLARGPENGVLSGGARRGLGAIKGTYMNSHPPVLTPQQTEQFEREGFLLVKGMLDDDTRQTIIASLSHMAARRAEYPPHAFVLEPDAAQAATPLDEVRKFQSLQVLNADLRRLFEGDSRPRRAASQLTKADDLRIQFLSCFAKPARIGGETPWHQDQGLWPLWMPTATSCWIALDAATLENGCVQFARGSHRRGMVRHEMPRRGNAQGNRRGNRQNRPNANRQNANAENQGLANMEEANNPNAGQGFPVDAPQKIEIPATNYAPPAGAIFVSPDARAGGAGTMEAPTTLQNALKTAPVGATIVLRGGQYRVGTITLPRRLTLQAYPGESPWIKGSVVVSQWVRDGALWRHDGWAAQFAPEGRLDRIIDPNYPMAVYVDQAFLNGKVLFQVGSREQVKAGRFFVDHDKDALYIGDDPAGKTVEATTAESGINIVRRGNVDAAGSVVRGIGVTHCARQGMIIAAPNVTIENCAIVWNGSRGLYFNEGSGAAPTDCVLRGSRLIANGQAGLSAGRATNLLVENNVASYNNVEGFRKQWGAAGIKFYGFDGLVCRDNVTEYNNGNSIWMDVDANKATIVRNRSNFNSGAGLFFEISDQAIIAFNVCRGNSIGVHLSGSHNARVYNNTLVDNDRAVRVFQGSRINIGKEGGTPDNKTVANTPPGAFFTARDNVFKNNIFWNSRPGATRSLFDVDFGVNNKQPSAALASNLMIAALSHNAYHRAGDSPATVQAWAPTGEAIARYARIEEFIAASGQGQNSLQTSGVDVYFVDAAQADYRLKPNSPAIGQAEPLPADVAKAAGVPKNIGYLGALPPA